MLDHVSLQVGDVDEAVRFYVGVFAPLGVTEVMRLPRGDSAVVALGGRNGGPRLWLGPVDRSTSAPAREVHLAFTAATEEEVRAVHAAATTAAVEVLHPPQEWPGYHPGYFAVHLRDPDGNNVEAVCHGS